MRSVARRVIIEELDEQSHPELVEDVIFWSLEYYAKHFPDNTLGKTIAGYIANRIKEEELKKSKNEN